MYDLKSLPFTLKTVEGDSEHGEFEAILSTADVDREGEIVEPRAFDPLPKSIPIHFDHDFLDKVPPIGRGEPYYEGDTLKVRGVFASSPRAQELRSLVTEGIIDSMSAGFITTKRKGKTVLKGDLVEGSLTATPVNRSALLLRSKSVFAPDELKAGARNSGSDMERLQQIHDLAVANGADCGMSGKSVDDLEHEDATELAAAQKAEADLATLLSAKSVDDSSTSPPATEPTAEAAGDDVTAEDEETALVLRARAMAMTAEAAAI